MTEEIFLGVDGCQTGWLSVEYAENSFSAIKIFSSILKLWREYSHSEIILIDIPIGLKEKGPMPRKCDSAARKVLTRLRSSSVFPVPCREAIYADSYLEANEINREKTTKGVSKQAWNICRKIREVDELLRNHEKARNIFIESHPEVCFTALAQGTPMQHYKRTPEGFQERVDLLQKINPSSKNFIEDSISSIEKSSADPDDIVDACVLSISAARGKSSLAFLPENYVYDAENLPMRMGYPKFK